MSGRLGFSNPTPFYEGKGDDGTDYDGHKSADMRLAREIWTVLHYHYRGHCWGVSVDHAQGVALIQIPPFSNWSFVIHLKTLQSDPGMKSVVKAGGELLERYDIPRAGFDVDHFTQALNKLPAGMTRPPE